VKAVVYARYGGPDVLRLTDVPAPVPGDREVLIRVRAAEATKSDCELRSFQYQVKWFWLPLRLAFGVTKPRRHILGGYFAGEVVSVGARVTRFAPGDGSTAPQACAWARTASASSCPRTRPSRPSHGT
jgi:NADPH:quinone reductase-like Zn-dependent oxidoreductase